MTLPYDIARCPGTTHPLCSQCRRREPRREWLQPYLSSAPIDMQTARCEAYIPPAHITTTNRTTA